MKNKNIYLQEFTVTNDQRAEKFNQVPKVIWFTGLSGSGKSSLSNALESQLFKEGFSSFILDGDNIRMGLCKDLEFSNKDRIENLRRVAEVCKLMINSGIIVLASFISPLKSHRNLAKKIIGNENFIEIYISTPLATCEKRDTKGLYKKAFKGEISNFTGVTSDYESPENPDIKIDTTNSSIEDSIEIIYNKIKNQISG